VKLGRRLVAGVVWWRLLGPSLRPRFAGEQVHPWRVPARTVFAGDHEFSVREAGPPAAPPIVLIHGLAGSSMAEWYKVGPRLAERFRVVMIDHRSHGFSWIDRGRFEIADEADDLAAVLEALALGPAGVVGYSMGGAIAQALAHRHPQLVTRLSLVATMAWHPPAWRWLRMLGVIVTRGWERLTGTGTPEVRAAYLLAVGAVEPRHGLWLWEETHRRDPDAGAAASMALLRFDSRSWLGELKIPVQVVVPLRDQLVPPSWQYQMAARIPHAAVVEVGGAHHELPWSHPDVLADALIEFLEKEGSSDGLVGEVTPDQESQA
jgi:3-oxoadipate enol-lactonase